ncbi:RteC domain-containing protein [Sphingobacterium deserti]|uniref:Tetracycline regulation of excision, RteC n=1 Tax=Sphingobacterium deserti TaxID=1229276 RepID=A0A0B8T599_9SPHI|nr:RteC domain-containing protein [Sphingobacterium deserti]KGE12674.1 tetracycline regulation of excision, RteC [Sphingobacterium deserti]
MKNLDFEKLYQTLLNDLYTINDPLVNSIIDFPGSLRTTVKTMDILLDMIRSYSFTDDREEIYFFKVVKPRFQAWHIYVVELYHIMSLIPVGTDQMIHKYYVNELKIIDRFFKRYAFYYQYYLAGEVSRDNDFFLRRNLKDLPPEHEISSKLTGFATSMDYLFAKFKAFEMLRDCLARRTKDLLKSRNIDRLEVELREQKRWWSGNKIELVELAYGLYHSKRINGGRAEVGEIIAWLEESLNVDLGQSYRMFIDISRRKVVSHTKFIDEMQNALDSYIQSQYGPRIPIRK